MIAAASATLTTAQNMTTIWLDYLLYYPFIDMDAAGEDQTMTNGVTLPRFTDGAGVRMMAVAQARWSAAARSPSTTRTRRARLAA